MSEPATAAEMIKVAQDLNKSRLDLIGAAAKRQQQIHALAARLTEEQAEYQKEYQAALSAWNRHDLDRMRLAPPDQVVSWAKPSKSTGGTKNEQDRARPKSK